MLSNVKKNLIAPISYKPGEFEQEQQRTEEGIERFYDEHPDLIGKVSMGDGTPLSKLIM